MCIKYGLLEMSECTYSTTNILSRVKDPLVFPFARTGLPRYWYTNVDSLANIMCCLYLSLPPTLSLCLSLFLCLSVSVCFLPLISFSHFQPQLLSI
jgi:hypothetical protein